MFSSALPDDARLWIYAADRPLTADEQRHVVESLGTFLANWSSHRRPVRGEAHLLDDRFLMIAGDIPGGDISGCGIDASVHALEAASSELGFGWASALTLFYRDEEGRVQGVSRRAFKQLAEAGRVTGATPVFELSLPTVGDFRSGRFERPAGESWHAAAFGLNAATPG